MFDERKIIKQYVTITKNIPKDSTGEINIPLIQREVNGIYKVSYLQQQQKLNEDKIF